MPKKGQSAPPGVPAGGVKAASPAKVAPAEIPTWLPDPDKDDLVNVVQACEQMVAYIQKGLGTGFANKKPLVIGDKGWSAPFSAEMGHTALSTTGFYQCAMNLFALKIMAHERNSICWRNVKYLADFYWNAVIYSVLSCVGYTIRPAFY